MKVWALVPARGGSKSIPKKNLAMVAGRPLLDYGLLSGLACRQLGRLYCSTDDEAIAQRARHVGAQVVMRPPELATDNAKVDMVAQNFLQGFPASDLPDAVALIQPTSPFLLPTHIEALISALEKARAAASAHNVAPVAHNLHAWNQREVDRNGQVRFLFAEERQRARNKQEKPKLYAFGNLIMARTKPLLEGKGFYAEPAVAIPIETPYDFDLDGPADIVQAETLLRDGRVSLAHLS
ncbi:MAG: hypothetical protein AB7K04_15200 [Pseudorhodoplanes sp.]